MLRELLQEAVGEVLSSEASAPELLSRFTGVYVQDGTIISLPPGTSTPRGRRALGSPGRVARFAILERAGERCGQPGDS